MGHYSSECKSGKKDDGKSRNCGKMGHYSSECKSGKKDDGKSSANCVSKEADDCLICAFESKMEFWVLDSGASFHATSHMDLFENYISGNFSKVHLGDDQACDITGKGDVKIHLNGSVWKLDNVRHVLDLRKNLISIGQLTSDGFGLEDVLGGRIVEHGSQKDEEQGVQPQVEELIPQDEIPTPHSSIGQRILNP
jgi:hypothetical protein